MNWKRTSSSGSCVSTEQKDSDQNDSEATSLSTCAEDVASSKSAQRIPRYSKKSTQVLQSSLQQHSVYYINADVKNCTDHSHDIGVYGS